MSEECQPIDYAAVLSDLEARKAQLEQAIAVIRPLVGGMTGSVPPSAPPPPQPIDHSVNGSSVDLREDAFFGLSIPDAAKKYLSMRKRPASTGDIIDALKRGGQINSTSDSFKNTVPSVLDRVNSTGKGIVRVSRGTWGLSDWYPNRPKKTSDEA